ncbi:MAG TPA: prealbumin-like fold domain-containing protein [Actinomycetota bacterium]|nr:prealbumin-like fold domain-containing protein [Actinomycetota bacterium]
MRKLCVVALWAMVMASVIGSPAPAGTAHGKWDKLGPASANFEQPGLARTSDGVLHAVWVRDNASEETKRDLLHAAISPEGTIGTTETIQAGWNFMWPTADLVVTSDGGLRAVWAGQRSLDSAETNKQMSTATAPAAGSPWTLQTGDVTRGPGAGASTVGAGTGPAGSGPDLFSWGATQGVFVHLGTDSSTPDHDYHAPLGGCCGYDPDIAIDAVTGKAWIAWYSNASGNEGVWAQEVDTATGAPVGTAHQMPGSVTAFQGEELSSQEIQRTPIIARAGGGIYVAYSAGYPSQTKIRLWSIGPDGPATTAATIAKTSSSGPELSAPALATDGGRVWVLWAKSDSSGRPHVYARRSNAAVSTFGRTVHAATPKTGECPSLYTISANAQPSRVDVVTSLTAGCEADIELWHTQLNPGLRIDSSHDSFTGKQKVTFTVTDAGDPISGATVTVAGKNGTTGADGKVTITLGPYPSPKKLIATATLDGFVKDSTVIKAKPPA